MNAKYSLGQVVYSKAGRDQGKRFVITSILNEVFITISDGSLRRMEKQKKKRVKHIEPTEIIIESIAEKLLMGSKITNAEIRKALATLDLSLENATINNNSDMSGS